MEINDKLIAYLGDLSKIALSEGEKLELQEDLTKILDYMDVLNQADPGGLPLSHPTDGVTGFRPDEVTPSWDRGEILKNAARHTGEYFIAPKTV